MPFLYIYSPSDFVVTPPSESGGAANGSPTFTLTLAPGTTGTLVEVTDTDSNTSVFDEVGTGQTVTNTVNLDGTTITAGTTIHSAYDLINSGNGHKVTSIHFGSNGYQQGAIQGMVSTIPLVPGQTYSFNSERTSHNQNNQYTDYVACFCSGTRIETDRGEIAVEDLQPGDRLRTEQGYRPLRLVLSRRVSWAEQIRNDRLRPIKINRGSLGAGLPTRDTYVSRQHRFVVSSPIVERMFQTDCVFVSAQKLTMHEGITPCNPVADVTYYHLVLDDHQVIYANATPTESFYCGASAISGMTNAARQELFDLFPELETGITPQNPALFIPKGGQQKSLIARHKKHQKPLLPEPRHAA